MKKNECEKTTGKGRDVLDEIHEEVEALRQTRQDYADTTDELRELVDRLKEDRAQL